MAEVTCGEVGCGEVCSGGDRHGHTMVRSSGLW